ncbi:tetratricopeptide repeat protein [Postechiella marina]|uniref:histidine kinase n=1 Tax=Postechiella marina TaxID=943941 RepID=A0ABP8CB94_9FLAO
MKFHKKSFYKIKLCIVVIFFCNQLIAQKQEKLDAFSIAIKEKLDLNKSSSFFYKAGMFFLNKEWDSVLVYTARHRNLDKNQNKLKDYNHYLRGYSFKQKLLLKEAKKEYKTISSNFKFSNLVTFRLAQVALEENKFEVAISYLNSIINLPDSQYIYLNKGDVLQNLGVCYLHLKAFDKAEPYLLDFMHYQEKAKDTLGIIAAYGNLANFYYEQYKDNLAIPYFEKAYLLSKSTNDFKKRNNASLNMAVVEENRKDFKKALQYRKEYEKWHDSLNDQNKIYEVAKLEKLFAVKQKQKEVSLLKIENKAKIIERNGLLYSALTLLILLGVTFYFYNEKIKSNKIIMAQKEGLDELNATKDKLFSIISHDLRSSVNALKSSNTKLLDNLEEKNLEALDGLLQNNSAIVNSAYSLLDNLLHWALLQTKQSYFEIEALRLFFIVEQMAYNYKPLMLDKSIDFNNKVLKKDIVLVDQESLKIILRNLLDNAIKFSKPNGKIKIYTTYTTDNFCDLVIEDSGLGMSKNTQNSLLENTIIVSKKENKDIIGTGLGLQLCKSLIQKNNGKLAIESELGKGTKMIVSLPKTTLNG